MPPAPQDGEEQSCRKTRFGRMIPAMVTPFDEELELDLDKVRALAVRLVEGGSDSLIVNGTTGESPTVFLPRRRCSCSAPWSKLWTGRVPIIANVGDNCTADTVSFAREVSQLGVDGAYVRGSLLQQAAAGGPLPPFRHHRRCGGACPSSCTTFRGAAW